MHARGTGTHHTEPAAPPGTGARDRSRRDKARALLLETRARMAHPAFDVMCSLLRLGSRLGVTWFLKMLCRPQWLFESNVTVLGRIVTFTGPADRTEADIRLCERIMQAYEAARGDQGDLGPIWTSKIERHHAALHAALISGDPERVDEQLRWTFRRPFLSGISTPIDLEDPAAPRYWGLMTFDSLVSLAEAIGVVRTECPEQGAVGLAFSNGIDALPGHIEEALQISLDFPRVGAPYGILIGGRLIIRETARHLHAAVRLREVIEVHIGRRPEDDVHVVEIGGGFGGAAMWYLRMLQAHSGSYTIIDLPLMNAFQAYLLAHVYGADSLRLFGEETDDRLIRILPPDTIRTRKMTADLAFNQDSLPEMSDSAAREYLSWIEERVSGLFVSCNQEAAARFEGTDQIVVAELARDFEGLRRISRQPSWTRRGYVEEIYRCRGLDTA